MRIAWVRLACLSLALLVPAAQAQPRPAANYAIKPSEVTVPNDVPLGQYRRSIRPYRNWTLICDENLKAKKRVCNVTQTIVDQDGTTAFSWTLAGTNGGSPVMILRTPARVGKDQPVTLTFDDRSQPIVTQTTGCNDSVCVAVQQVGPRLKAYIAKGVIVQITFPVPASALPNSGKVSMGLFGTLDGLSEAVAGI